MLSVAALTCAPVCALLRYLLLQMLVAYFGKGGQGASARQTHAQSAAVQLASSAPHTVCCCCCCCCCCSLCALLCVCSHLDRDDCAEKTAQVFTVILYLSSGANSTAFPNYPKADFVLPDFDSASKDASVRNQKAMQKTVEDGLLNDNQYSSWPVQAGDMAFFSQATMHFGTQNLNPTPRQALFSIFTPFDGERQDDAQIFRSATSSTARTVRGLQMRGSRRAAAVCACHAACSWWYVNYAYDTQSRQLAQAVWRDQQYSPIDGIDMKSDDSRTAFISSCLRWKVIDYSPAKGDTAAKITWLPQEHHAPAGEENARTDAEVEAAFHHGIRTKRTARHQPEARAPGSKSLRSNGTALMFG